MSASFSIGSRKVGIDFSPLVIVEIGINHGGCLKTAKLMVDEAIRNGAELIKHQTHIVEDEMSELAKQTIPGNTDKSIYDVIAECALNESDERELKEYVESKGAIFISTPFSRAAADRLESFGVEAYKVGSGECSNIPLLKHIAKFGKPIILSTGMNTLEAVRDAVDVFEMFKVPYALLHTTNLYPTPDHLVRLGAITELRENFPNAVVGLSDHTISNHACFGAVALGASILERHFTDSMERIGPDIICSMDGPSLKRLIQGTEILSKQRGGTKTVLLDEEQVTRDFAFATVVATKDIQEGEVFTRDNIWVKRPGVGDIQAKDYESLIGKKAANDIDSGSHISRADVY